MTTSSLPSSEKGFVRTVWVTGAGSGVGRAVAVSAARAGARVVLTGRRVDALSETAALVRDAGGQALELPADTSREDELQRAWTTLQQTWGDPPTWCCPPG